MSKREDLTGQKFGRLTALKYVGAYRWECVCECGTIKAVQTGKLKKGETRSCGCLKLDIVHAKPKHGMWGSREYNTWAQMIARCVNPKATNYDEYGGRGIKVCDRWLESFENFLADMGERPEGMTLDRIEVDGNYDPGNCRWATNAEQARNTRRNVYIEANGERMVIFDWAKRSGIHETTIMHRLKNGWSPEDAVTTPTNRKNKHNASHIHCPQRRHRKAHRG